MTSSTKTPVAPAKLEPPVTPSQGINEKLREMAEKRTDSAIVPVLSQAVFAYFRFAVLVNSRLSAVKAVGDKCDARQMWMLSVGTVCSLTMIAASVAYNLIMSLSFLFVWTLYYVAVLLGLTSVGLSAWSCMSFRAEGTTTKAGSIPRPKVSPPPTPDSQTFAEL